ncbi:sugar ABC transporter permease [Salipaludibacillus agaradhaerens]|jgi:putative aldouronate transport system permease protein|uniref:Sugar ABC transporter permease n=1 Tax=Salipaludibacillus agaradhaerens TaxID=76935 RepID=A0A9Q4AYX9_SALAG|nr:sugar ABC transporter permease [Salipaludibacillus agaradhaerens]UJW58836.1 sugar ABC transporter permease [Bacillus sp. A116_S68]MCR6095346.1 sugar ABC transporter permease [Salipaludibacillus agaradhaerens]MCR6107749.1 sugar ABC transporter permease [Salipaludibacillus agaradhaerens]MCR6115096.1 sugar ABC transporter permease [Salipaludibacillus agaradhaerens]MCR6119778.1 sugar ABC transporter permease [Salipaludibacillus agaradhaerens]
MEPQLQGQVETLTKSQIRSARKKEIWKNIKKNKLIYLMILPGFIYFFIYKYIPMYGLVIAFQNYQPYLGITGSEWVGFEHFHRLFTGSDFWMIFRNTLVLFGLQLFIYFPIPIILALMLNEVRHHMYKRTIQTLIYIPHFMSWVVIVSVSFVVLTLDGGIVNGMLEYFGFQPINFLMNDSWFRPMYILQVIWREAGWGTIIFLAAISAVDPQLYEAARMDGANRIRQMWHITLPAIKSVIVILLILKIGDVLELGFEHVYLLLNASNREVGEIFDTYVYTAGLRQGQFSYSTAVGFFKGIVGLILIIFANRLAKKFGEEGVY